MIIDSYVRHIQIVRIYPLINAKYHSHVNELDIHTSNEGEVDPKKVCIAGRKKLLMQT